MTCDPTLFSVGLGVRRSLLVGVAAMGKESSDKSKSIKDAVWR